MTGPTGAWAVDPERSTVEFAVKHMLLATLRGRFADFEGVLRVDGDGPATAGGSVDAASIDTGDAVRDSHLRDSADFFDVERHPRITFSSTRVERHADTLRVVGGLTMRGITREIVLDGPIREAQGDGDSEVLTLTLRGELNRRDFGLTWNQKLDSGGALVGNTVRITLELRAAKIPAKAGAGALV
jgi:polyisoprenoid-binding protein YceI